MSRPLSKLAPAWWDYTTLDPELLNEAAKLAAEDLPGLARPGFDVRVYDTPQEFYSAEALEYVEAWRQSTPDNPVGICGPIGPTEQLPIVAQMVNALGVDLGKNEAHFWGWTRGSKTASRSGRSTRCPSPVATTSSASTVSATR